MRRAEEREMAVQEPKSTQGLEKFQSETGKLHQGRCSGAKKGVHLRHLDGIRGVASLYVVMHHFLSWSAVGVSRGLQLAISWTAFGHLGVVLFIVLSGFSLMLPVASSPDRGLKGGVAGYMGRRAKRILPPYFAALVLSIGVIIATESQMTPLHRLELRTIDDLSFGSVTSHVLLFHNISSKWALSINMAFWSIATEWQIYMIFPLVLLPIWKKWGPACIIAGFLLGMSPLLLFSPSWNFEEGCPWFIGLFAMGMCSASYFVATPTLYRRSRWIPILTAISLLMYICLKITLSGDRFAPLRDASAGLVCCGAIISLSIPGAEIGAIERAIGKMLMSGAVVRLGSFSYSLYLTHCVVLNVCRTVAGRLALSPDASLLFRAFIGIPVAVCIAYCFYLICERPFVTGRAIARDCR
jgi:peptidoglycan/LPS O-acetylase OafA/YrhL